MTDYQPTLAYREVAARLRGLIARHGISQRHLALVCGVSQSQFSKMVRAVRPMSVDQLAAICDALEVDFGDFMRDVQDYVSERSNHSGAAMILVVDGVPVEEPRINDPELLDEWGASIARAALASEAAPNVTDAMDIADEVHGVDAGKKETYGLAAKRGRRKADIPHAE